jgi:hypothetical protein
MRNFHDRAAFRAARIWRRFSMCAGSFINDVAIVDNRFKFFFDRRLFRRISPDGPCHIARTDFDVSG